MEIIPWILTGARFSAALFLLLLPLFSKRDKNKNLFLFVFIPAFATDFLDGFVMRHFAKALLVSDMMGRLDSSADALLYIAAFVNVWRLRPNLIKRESILIIVFMVLQLFSWGLAITKYGNITSYHWQIARICGASLFLSFLEMVILDRSRLLRVAFIIGLIYLFTEIKITWTHY